MVAILIYLRIIVIKWRHYYVAYGFRCKQAVFSCKNAFLHDGYVHWVLLSIDVLEKRATVLDHPVFIFIHHYSGL